MPLTSIMICRTTDVSEGDMKQFNIWGNEILVVNLKNQFYCLDARCTHAGAPLAEGELNEEILTCPWHGSRFNVTDGSVVNGPAEKPLTVFPSSVKDDYLYIEL